MVLLIEPDLRVYDDRGHVMLPYPPRHPQHAWMPIFSEAVSRASRKLGADSDALYKMQGWLEATGSFEHLESHDLLLPTHPWYDDPGTISLLPLQHIKCKANAETLTIATERERTLNMAGTLYRRTIEVCCH